MFQCRLNAIGDERAEKLAARESPDDWIVSYEGRILTRCEAPSIRAAMQQAREMRVTHPGINYYLHPLRVAAYVAQCRTPPSAQCVVLALVHNVMEVAAMTKDDVEQRFGAFAANGCELLTVDRKAQASDPTYMADYYSRLRNADGDVRAVKALDKLDNLLTLYQQPSALRRAAYFEEIRHHVVPIAETVNVELAAYLLALVADNELLAAQTHDA